MTRKPETTSKEVASKAGWYLAQVKNRKFRTCISYLERQAELWSGYAAEDTYLLMIRLLKTGKSLAASCATQAPDKKRRRK